MKVSGEVKSITVTQTALARALNLSPPRVHQLIEEEIVVRDEKDNSGGVFLFESVRNYYLSQKAAREDANLFVEKAKHERVKRQIAELKLAREEGRLYEASVVEAAMIEQLVGLRTHLLALGNKLSPLLEGKSKAEMAEIINREVEEKLKEMSEYKPGMFGDEVEGRTASDDAKAGAGADREDKRKQMGG